MARDANGTEIKPGDPVRVEVNGVVTAVDVWRLGDAEGRVRAEVDGSGGTVEVARMFLSVMPPMRAQSEKSSK